jgi:hypothetical protein
MKIKNSLKQINQDNLEENTFSSRSIFENLYSNKPR